MGWRYQAQLDEDERARWRALPRRQRYAWRRLLWLAALLTIGLAAMYAVFGL
jgi:hypothetical protein